MNRIFNYTLLIFSTNLIFSQLSNPCIDKRYLDIKNKSLDKMSDREYEYFSRKDKECSDYKQSIQPSKKMGQTVNKPKAYEPKSVPEKMETINLYGTTKSLTISQNQHFNRERLTIEIISKTTGSAAATPIGKSAVLATYGSQTSRKWTASKGFDKISEESFLRIAGYDEEANVVKQYASTNSIFVGGGLLAILTGMLIGQNARKSLDESTPADKAYSDEDYEKFDKSSTMSAIIGVSGILVLVKGFVNISNNYYEYSVVDGIAEDYNKKLLQDIKASEY